MKKQIYLACALVLGCMLHACIDDKGNYTYLDREDVTSIQISNIEENYSVLTGQPFTIEPVVEGIDNEEDYEHLWYIYGISISRGWRDTIGREKALDYLVNIVSGTYEITYKIKNKKTSISAYASTSLRVTTDFSQGWFITKEQDNVTDIDMVSLDGRLSSNLISTINGSGVPGKAIKSTFEPMGYNYVQQNPDGTVTLFNYQPVFFVITESDLHVIGGNNFTRYATFEESFYEVPAVKKPREVLSGVMCAVLLNDGKVHEMPIIYANAARFGNPIQGSTSISPYFFRHLSKGFLAFDQESRSFKVIVFWQPFMQSLSDDATSLVPCNNMDYDLVYMQEQAAHFSLTEKGFAIFRHRETGKYYGAVLNDEWVNFKNPIVSFIEIPAESQEVTRATVRGVNSLNDVIYYSDGGNTVGQYNVINGIEKRNVLVYEAGETVAAIEHTFYRPFEEHAASQNCLSVLTNKAGKWTLRLYKFMGTTADVETTTPYATYTGEGNARDFLFRTFDSVATN
jgi:hypothetical protein